MKTTDFIYTIIFGTIIAISLGLFFRNISENKTANDYELIIEEKNWQLDNAIEYITDLEQQIDTLEAMVKVAYDSSVLFEIIVGVEEPNGIVEYKEKLMITHKNINKINKAKLD